MAAELKVTHAGIEIEYQEQADQWRFELRGRERFASTLRDAREAIDKAPKDKPSFERFECYKDEFISGFKRVTVTSVAEKTRWSTGSEVWISDGGKRHKTDQKYLFAICPENDAAIQRIQELEKQAEELNKQCGAIRQSMKRVEITVAE